MFPFKTQILNLHMTMPHLKETFAIKMIVFINFQILKLLFSNESLTDLVFVMHHFDA